MLKVLAPGKVVITQVDVRISTAYDGGHQAFAHLRAGTYWEACYIPGAEERMVQQMITDPRYGKTQHHWAITDIERARRPLEKKKPYHAL